MTSNVSSLVARRVLRHCSVDIVESGIDPSALARRLCAKEIISENFDRIVRERKTGDSNDDRREKILDHLKDLVKNDASTFTAFLNVLSDLGRDDLTNTIRKKYSGKLLCF